MVHNKTERKGEEWSGIEYVAPLFECLTSLMREGKGYDNYSLIDPQFGGLKDEGFEWQGRDTLSLSSRSICSS